MLKGPQGALYGRNATGGAINITTKQPTSEPEVYVRGGYGNGDNLQLSGVASGPLGSNGVLGRVVVGYKDAEGWRDNVATGVKADPYEDLTVAGKLLWDSSASTTLDLRLTYSDTESTGSQFVSNAPNFVTGFPGNAQCPGNGSAPPVPGLPASITALIGDPNNTSIKHQGNEPGMDDREAINLSAKIDWTSRLRHADVDHVVRHARPRDRRRAVRVLPVRAGRRRAQAPAHPAGVVVPAFAQTLDDFGTGQNLTFGQNRFHDSVQPGAAHHIARRWPFALDRRRVLRADRSRRDDLDQQRFRPRLRGAAHGPEHRRHQSDGDVVAAIPRAVDPDRRRAGRDRAEPEHERRTRSRTTSTATTTRRTRCSARSTTT